MADLYWPSSLEPAQSRFEIVDGAGRFPSTFTGRVRTVSRPGATRIRATLDVMNLKGERRAALQSFIAGQLGAVNRVWLKDHSYTRRGSFPATELFTNNIFESGTTGWTANNAALSAADQALRLTPTSLSSPSVRQSTTGVQYAPYVLRSIIRDGRGSASLSVGRFIDSGSFSASDYSTTARGYGALSLVRSSAGSASQYPAVINSATGYTTSDFLEVLWASYARCALADGGGNLLLQSQDFTTTWVNTRSTDAANSTAAPDGTTTADSIIEDATASNSHFVAQDATVTSAAADIAFSCSLKAGTRTWALLLMNENTGNTQAYVYVNLSTGALGTAASAGNWSNERAFVVSQGNGWYRVTVVARKTNAATAINCRVHLATGNGASNYSGDGASLIYAWGASLTQSSVPVRYVSTTGTASSATTQTGTGLYLKGLPASTSGLLLIGDQVQVGNELKFVTASLDSDAAGLGYLQFAPEIREPVANDAPVIVHEPMGLFMLEQQENGWENTPGVFSAASLQLIEATP